MSSTTVVYVLLVTVVVALVLSWIQMWRSSAPRVFVPSFHIHWLKQYAPDHPENMNLDLLVPHLTESYHLMTLHLLGTEHSDYEDPATLFKTLLVQNDGTIEIHGTTRLEVNRGDVVTWPSLFTASTTASAGIRSVGPILCWSIHPVAQSVKDAKRDRAVIHAKWARMKRCPVRAEINVINKGKHRAHSD